MGNATGSPNTLADWNDLLWAATGTIGYRILLRDGVYSGTWTVDAGTDVITTAAENDWVTGQRVRASTTGVFPALSSGGIVGGTDYFWIKVTDDTGRLALTLADALANTYVNITDTGSGTHTLTEQALANTDPIEVLVNKEVAHAEYARKPLTNVGDAVEIGAFAEKNPVAHSYSVSSGSYTFKYVLYLFGSATSTVGDTAGDKPMLETLTLAVTIDSANPYVATTVLRTRNI